MPAQQYIKHPWVNGLPPALEAPNLLQIEEGLDLAYAGGRWLGTDRGALSAGVVSGMAVTAHTPNDLSVAVAAGVVSIAGSRYTYAGGNLAITGADTTQERWDVVEMFYNTGALAVATGTGALAASIPDNAFAGFTIPLAAIYRPINQQFVAPADIRPFSKLARDPLSLDDQGQTGGAIILYVRTNPKQIYTLTSNVTGVSSWMGSYGQELTLIFKQDGVGGRTLPAAGSWTNFKFADTISNTGNTAGKYWIGNFINDNGPWLQVGDLKQWF